MKASFVISLLVACALSSKAYAQQAKLEGYVFNDKDQRVSTVQIIAPGGQSKETDSQGHFVIPFPNSIKPGQATRIEVVKPNWVIYEPMLGNCVTQSSERNYEPLKIIIVPKSSPLALSPKRLGRVIAKWADERVKLRSQVNQLDSQFDKYAFLKEYSEKYGFTLDQFNNAAAQWAQTKESDDKEEQALKEYFLKNYERAAQLAHESALGADQELEQANKRKTEASLKVIRRFKLEGNARDEKGEFREALAAYNEIEKRFSTRVLSKEDLIEEWAETKLLLGNEKGKLGTGEGRESQRLSGENLRLLSESVTEYRQALTVFTREQSPQQWADTQNNLGISLSVQGEHMEGAEGVRLLTQGAEAYREVLKVRTREKFPEDWARVQNNLGAVLRAQGERMKGAGSRTLLAQAEEAYREALKIRTREQFPEKWAQTQNNLGVVLMLQGERSEDAEGEKLFARSVEAYREALKVRTREQYPEQWAQTQNNLADVCFLLRNWSDAAEFYANVLTINPTHEHAYGRLIELYHERLFKFEEAFALNQRWLARHPDDISVQADFAEKHFTTGRFAESSQLINALLTNPEVPVDLKAALRAVEIAGLLALGQAKQVPARLDALIAEVSRQTAEFKVDWSFEGTKHFIGQNEKLSPYRAWLEQLFAALDNPARDQIVKGLNDAKAAFK